MEETPPWARHAMLMSLADLDEHQMSCTEFDKREFRKITRSKIALLSTRLALDRGYD